MPEPEVRLVASTKLELSPDRGNQELFRYVDSVGGKSWTRRITDSFRDFLQGETLIEAAGRLCYRSWDVGLNPNVTKVREDSEEYLKNIVKSGHGSVLEHVTCTFVLSNVSRVFTHELVRHRVGTAISQESLRYVRLDEIPFKTPDWVEANPVLKEAAEKLLAQSEDFQKLAAVEMGLDNFGIPFDQKKVITSDMRRYAPDGVLTSVVWTANLRTLRDVIILRTSPHAEQELRLVFDKIANIVVKKYPSIFADFVRSETGNWTSTLI